MSAASARRWVALSDPAAFQAAMSSRPVARSEHFVLHHAQLSTAGPEPVAAPVDDRLLVGLVVPKRHARRAATRNLIKRQARSAFDARSPLMAGGRWVLRLRAPFDRQQFKSAASAALQVCVRDEIGRLFQAAPLAVRG
jgi:ribonuclease P protein component